MLYNVRGETSFKTPVGDDTSCEVRTIITAAGFLTRRMLVRFISELMLREAPSSGDYCRASEPEG